MEANFEEEVLANANNDAQAIRFAYDEALKKERTCGEFTKWIPGHSPEHHLKVRDVSIDRLRTEIGERLAEQAVEQNRLAKQITAIEETRHQENRKDSSSGLNKQLIVMWVALVITAALTIIQLFK
tara:strand:+ start:958 stop:1335 length:378 start_codon:yes stop_codon:yes gene_type:complete